MQISRIDFIRNTGKVNLKSDIGRFGLLVRVGGVPFTSRKVDIRLPGKKNSNSHGARPVHLITTMI